MSILDVFLTPEPKRKFGNPRNKQPENDHWLIVGAAAALLAVVFLISWDTSDDPSLETAGFTYVLVDLSEKLTPLQSDDLKKTIKAAVNQPHPNQVIYTYQMLGSTFEPVKELEEVLNQNFSKFFSDFGAAFSAENDCPKVVRGNHTWNRSISRKQKQQITEVCRKKKAHEDKVVKATTISLGKGKKQSPIITAIEFLSYEAIKKSNDRTVDTRLIIFSDMLQNEDWFTQYTNVTSNGKTRRVIKGNDHWTAEKLRDARQRAISIIGDPIHYKFDAILICYLKHKDINLPAFNKKHREMWSEYLSGGGYADEYGFADNGECEKATKRTLENR